MKYELIYLSLLFICIGVNGCGLPDINRHNVRKRSRSRRATEDLDPRLNCGSNDPVPAVRTDTVPLVEAILELMRQENVDALLVPTADAHQSEYVALVDGRREAISGFTGSAGTAVILANGTRALWTDGRYFLQAEDELDCNWILMKEEVEKYPTIIEWLKDSLETGSSVGADPLLTSAPDWLSYEKELDEVGISIVPTSRNLVDQVAPPSEDKANFKERPLQVLELKYAGQSWEDKVEAVRMEMRKMGVEMMVVTALDEVAWLLNLRGGDIPEVPVFKSYAVIDDENVKLFVKEQITPKIDMYLHVNQCYDQECVEIHDYNTVKQMIAGLASRSNIRKVMLPAKLAYSGGVNYAIYSAVPEEKRMLKESPIMYMKARKNEVEKAGMRNAHMRDAVALIDFLSFLEEEMAKGNEWTELSAAEKLTEYRSEQEDFEGLSFEAISAMGPNGAIIHYRPQNATDAVITDQSLYLLDSGGQYKDGTTDVTRTMHYGTPTPFQIEAYTRVLMGALDLASLVFPKGTKDTRVDVLARKSLYAAGLDYKHGTGHGIGMFLGVHESPIQVRIYGPEEHELEEGQFFSDEPGYYKDGEFGIRLETILSVVPFAPMHESFVPMLAFEPITLVPFEPKLIDTGLLSNVQCEFLNMYHQRVENAIGPLLQNQGRNRAYDWMVKRTAPLVCSSGQDAEEVLVANRKFPQMLMNANDISSSTVQIFDFKMIAAILSLLQIIILKTV